MKSFFIVTFLTKDPCGWVGGKAYGSVTKEQSPKVNNLEQS